MARSFEDDVRIGVQNALRHAGANELEEEELWQDVVWNLLESPSDSLDEVAQRTLEIHRRHLS